MKNRQLIVAVESSLMFLQGVIGAAQMGNDRLSTDYPYARKSIGPAEEALKELGLLDEVKGAVDQSEALARAGDFDEASLLVSGVLRSLMEKSGTADNMNRRFGKNAKPA